MSEADKLGEVSLPKGEEIPDPWEDDLEGSISIAARINQDGEASVEIRAELEW